MAKLLLLCFLPLLCQLFVVSSESESPSNLPQGNNSPVNHGPERLSHIHFFWHDTSGGLNPSAVTVAQSPTSNSSSTKFGTVRVFDDPMTVGPLLSSQLVGRSQGIYLSADQHTSGLLMAMTFHFVGGKFNGSTLAVLGRNEIGLPLRELAIIGGTGLFRFATGYAQAHTQSSDPSIGYTLVEYNVYFILSKPKTLDAVDVPLI